MPTHTSQKHAGRRTVKVRRVDQCETLHDLFTHCLPAFGGAHLRRIYQILDRAIGMGCPLTLAISGPVTVSGQHQTWLLPMLETGWVAYLSTTDAVCYHDGHRSLDAYKSGPIHEVSISSDDAALRAEGTIRVTDMAFDERVLLDQDRFVSAVLTRPEFQRKIEDSLFAGQKVTAVQLYRDATESSLAESKAAIDEMEVSLRAEFPTAPWEEY